MIYRVAIAGSTAHTVQCAEALRRDQRFEIAWVLTPSPKPVGRQQLLTKNPLQVWAETHHFPVIFIERKITQLEREQILAVNAANGAAPLDFLLVVDFGYLVPKWLLELPARAALNVHPSALPRWRGSAPGQFAILFGEPSSAVTLMTMNEGLDTGDIVTQLDLPVSETWTQRQYYQEAFSRIEKVLSDSVVQLAEGTLKPVPQPSTSPTPVARKLSKDDSFVDWVTLQSALDGTPPIVGQTSPLLQEVFQKTLSWPLVISRAARAFSPWPGLWTLAQTTKGEKRMKILSTSLLGETSAPQKLTLDRVQIEGSTPTSWESVQHLLKL